MFLFLSKKVADKEITHQEIADTFEKYQKNPGGYLYALKTGVSIQLDHILKAQKHFGLNPCDLFSKGKKVTEYSSEHNLSAVEEEEEAYETNISKLAETVRSQQRVIESLLLKKGTG